MSSLTRFFAWWNALVAAGLVSVSVALRDWLTSRGFGSPLAIIALALVALITVRVADGIARSLVHWSPGLRSVIIGADFIEGDWIDYNLDHDAKLLLAVSLVHIGFRDGRLLFGGEVFSSSGVSRGNFDASLCGYSDRVLWYIYGRDVALDNREKATGRGELRFTRTRERPQTYYGSFFDPVTKREVEVKGEKLSARARRRLLWSEEGRRKVVCDAIEKYVSSNSGYACRDQASIQGALTR